MSIFARHFVVRINPALLIQIPGAQCGEKMLAPAGQFLVILAPADINADFALSAYL
jgi:hypothetical protein